MKRLGKDTNKILGEKFRIVYKLYCLDDKDKLVELFSNEKTQENNKNYLKSRRRVINRYLTGDNIGKETFAKEYEYFGISQLKVDNEPLFTLDEFIDSDIESFTQTLKDFIEYEKSLSKNSDHNYRYLYMYDEGIICYKINYLGATTKNCWSIEVTPPKSKKMVQKYEGTLTLNKNKISLTLENEFDHVTMIFETSLKSPSVTPALNNILYGIAIGINDQTQKIPIAKKVILTESKMEKKELACHYLVLNETQQLKADENVYKLENPILNVQFLSRYQQKITNLHRFFSKVKYSSIIQTSLPQHMIFTEFHAFKKMFDGFATNQNFFLSDRKRVYLEFLRFLKNEGEEEVYMVLPIHNQNENIFLYESLGKESIKELFISLAKKGVKFNIIFVTKQDQYDFQSTLSELNDAGINISFIDKKDIDNSGLNEEFFYANSHKYTVVNDQLSDINNFTILQNKHQQKKYLSSFAKISDLSYKYQSMIV
jgi:hypothetical protein